MRPAEFAEMVAFAEIASRRSFSKAAAHLGVSRSALSQTLRALEQRLNVRLLNRTTRTVSPTIAGERLLEALRPHLDGLQDAMARVGAAVAARRGMLRLRVPRLAGALILKLVGEFQLLHPAVTVELIFDGGLTDVKEDEADAGISIRELIGPNMYYLRIAPGVRSAYAASPDYLARHPAPLVPRDLQGHNCIRYRRVNDGEIHPWRFQKDGRQFQVVVDGSLIVNDLDVAVRAAVNGQGIAYVIESHIADLVAEGRLVALLGDWASHRSGLFLYYRKQPVMPPALTAFVDFVRDV